MRKGGKKGEEEKGLRVTDEEMKESKWYYHLLEKR